MYFMIEQPGGIIRYSIKRILFIQRSYLNGLFEIKKYINIFQVAF